MVADGGYDGLNCMDSHLAMPVFLLLPLKVQSASKGDQCWASSMSLFPEKLKKLLNDKSTILGLFLLRLPFLPAVPQPTKWSIGWWLVLLPNLHNLYYFLVNFLWFFSCEKLYSWYTIFNFVTSIWLSILYFLIFHLFSEAWNTWEI